MSKLSVSCPSCAKRYGVPEEHAGKKFKCKDCGATISIPAAAAAAEPEEPAAGEEEEPAPPKRRKSTTHRRPARRRPAPASRRRGSRSSSEDAEESPARAGHRRGGTRRPTGGRSTRGRRGARAHDDEDGGREYGSRQQQPNKNLLILSAVACVVLLVALIAIFAFPKESGTSGKRTKKRSVAAKAENEFVPPKIVINPEDEDPGFGAGDEGGAGADDPGFGSDPVVEKKPEKKPKKKPKKAEPKKPGLPPIPRAKVRKLDHLESTPAETREAINEAIEVVKDPWSGARGNRKRKDLVKFGKAAVPALLSAMVDLDFSQEDARSTMTPLTEVLQEITKTPNSYICRVGMMGSEEANTHMCKYFRALWYEWYDGRIGRRYMEE
jgi:hypothetical protein